MYDILLGKRFLLWSKINFKGKVNVFCILGGMFFSVVFYFSFFLSWVQIHIWTDLKQFIISELLLKFQNNLYSRGWGQFFTHFEWRGDEGKERLIKVKCPGSITSLWQTAAELEKWLWAAWPNSGYLLGCMIKPSPTFSTGEHYKSSVVEKNPEAIGDHYNFWSGNFQILFYTYGQELWKIYSVGRTKKPWKFPRQLMCEA